MKLKFGFICPGILPVSYGSFGAVEYIVAVMEKLLTRLGHEVRVYNTKDLDFVINDINSQEWDVVSLEYDCYYPILDKIKTAKRIIQRSHYPHVDKPHLYQQDNYGHIFKFFCLNAHKYPIFAVSEKDRQTYLSYGVNPKDIYLAQNGASSEDFAYNPTIKLNKTICLGQINPRKGQQYLWKIPNIDFVGKGQWNFPSGNYLGEWTGEYKFAHLTDYANLVLLSSGENGTPLVVKEALMCGLGICVSEDAAHELPKNDGVITHPYIRIVKEAELNNPVLLEQIITTNRIAAKQYRAEARAYALANFEWSDLIKKYVENIICLLE